MELKTLWNKLFYKAVVFKESHGNGAYSAGCKLEPRWRLPNLRWFAQSERRFRLDVNLWEQENRIAFVRWYVYSVREGAKLRTFWKVRKLKGAVYFHYKPLPPIELTQAEARARFGDNKYLWPQNFKYVA